MIARDKERVHLLETAVVTWTNQIKHVLKAERRDPFFWGVTADGNAQSHGVSVGWSPLGPSRSELSDGHHAITSYNASYVIDN